MIKILLGFLFLAATHANVFKKGIFHVIKDIEIDDKVKVNGGWSDWSGYLACSVTCGCGIKKRTRTCTNPGPSRGGNNCVGDFSEAAICNLLECPINGGWSYWGNYLACSVTCGCGIKIRTRNCTNPAPSRGGNSCDGDFSEAAICNLLECPTSTTTTSAPITTTMVLSTTNAASKTITAPTTTTPTTVRTNICLDGWSENAGNCYICEKDQKTYQDSLSSCKSYGGSLLSVENQAEYSFILKYMSQKYLQVPYFWIGFDNNKNKAQKKFEWTDGTPVTYTNWYVGEPNNANGIEHCTGVEGMGGFWNDISCDYKLPYICKVKKVRTNICLDGWSENAGNCYICEKDQKTYQDSLSSCKSYGGSLLSVENQAEYSFILKYMSQKYLQVPYFWIGFDDNKNKAQKKFEWTDGTPVTYTNWNVGEPNNANGIEHCTGVEGMGGFWNDVSCDYKLPYICKVKKGTTITPTTLAKPNSLQGDSILPKSKRNLKLKYKKKQIHPGFHSDSASSLY